MPDIPQDAPVWQIVLFLVIIPAITYVCREFKALGKEVKSYLNSLLQEREKFIDLMVERDKRNAEAQGQMNVLIAEIRDSINDHTSHSKAQSSEIRATNDAIKDLAQQVHEMHVTVGRKSP